MAYKSIRYKDILRQFPDAPTAANANIKVPGNTPRPPFVSAPGTYPYAHNIYFETPETATDKLNFLKRVGAHGVIIWELSNDVWEGGKSVIQALYQNSGNPETRLALPPSNGKPSVPSDILVLYIERIINYTNKFADEVERGQEKETSQLSLLVEPSLAEAIAKYFKEAGKKDGKEIKSEDAKNFTEQWRKIEELARNYDAKSPEADSLIRDIKNKIDRLSSEVESKIDEDDDDDDDDDDGWLFVPFYSVIAFFKTYTWLEWFVRENPSPIPDPDDVPKPKPGPSPIPKPPGPGPIPKPELGPIPEPALSPVPQPSPVPVPQPSPSPEPEPEPEPDPENEEKECERQAEEVSRQIQQSIEVLTDAMEKWPKMDLGPIESILGIPTRPEEPPPEEPPPEEPPRPPILLPSDNRFFAPLADGILYSSSPGIQMINKSISESDFGGEIITVFEIKTQEGCDAALQAYIKVGSFELEQIFKAFGDFFSSLELPSWDEDFVEVDWRYEIGDRVFTYVAGGSGFAFSEKLFVCKRQGQIFYIGDLDKKRFPEFKKHFNIDPLS